MIFFSLLLYYCILIPVSLLPFRVLYFLSDVMYVIMYRILGYRKKVVYNNIRNSFPHETREYHFRIMNEFYHHLCDLVVESIKVFTISEQAVLERMICRNPEVFNRYFEENRSVIIAGGHFNNWELFAVAVHRFIRHRPVGIYQPLTSKFFDRKMRETRGKFGLEMLSTKKVKQFFEDEKSSLTATIFAIDQSPGSGKNSYWLNFLNQETAVSFGMEKYAAEYNYPVIFGRLNKLKRGHYELEFEELSSDPASLPYGHLTEKATTILEADILKAPQYWLWSHRRWKKKRDLT